MSAEPVRAYLLGTLEENSAASVEERYFTDREFFLFVQSVETALIDDYLSGRLPPSVKAQFEARYLSVPDLRRRLEEVRKRRTSVNRRRMFGPRSLRIAAMVLMCVGGAIFWFYRDYLRFERLQAPPLARPVVATLALIPGVSKGDGAGIPTFGLRSEGFVQLELELPGQREQMICSVQVSIILPDGVSQRVWFSPQLIWSYPIRGGQRTTLMLDASLLHRGDYLVELVGADTRVRETYVFRLSPQ